MIKEFSLRHIKAILLDRDGTINVERADYVRTVDQFVLLPNAEAALGKLATLQLPVAVVTNQSGIGRGLLERRAVDAIHAQLAEIAASQGVDIRLFAVCPHHPEDGCACRKPKPGLLLQAADHMGVAPSECLLIGDSISDCQAALAAGCAAILVRTGRQGAQLDSLCKNAGIAPEEVLVVADLLAAAALLSDILGQDASEPLLPMREHAP